MKLTTWPLSCSNFAFFFSSFCRNLVPVVFRTKRQEVVHIFHFVNTIFSINQLLSNWPMSRSFCESVVRFKNNERREISCQTRKRAGVSCVSGCSYRHIGFCLGFCARTVSSLILTVPVDQYSSIQVSLMINLSIHRDIHKY